LFWFNGVETPVLIAQLFIVQNLSQTYGSFAPSWSITNEMFYYVFYGLLVCVALRQGVRATTLGMLICGAMALVADGLYFGVARSPLVLGPGLLFGLGTIWFLGALVADHRGALLRSRAARVGSRFWMVVLASAIAMWSSQRVHLQVVYVVLGVGFALMLVRFLFAEEASAPRRERHSTPPVVQMLGLASYPTYLFHGPLLMLVASAILRWNLVSDWRLTCLILVLVGLSSGIALGYFLESPIMRWRAAFLKRMSSARSSAIGGLARVGVVPVQH
jgi:peptidoglycan/LPS O-acetylase OafA/YrhL